MTEAAARLVAKLYELFTDENDLPTGQLFSPLLDGGSVFLASAKTGLVDRALVTQLQQQM